MLQNRRHDGFHIPCPSKWNHKGKGMSYYSKKGPGAIPGPFLFVAFLASSFEGTSLLPFDGDNLVEVELHRGGTAEDLDENADLLLLLVDFLDGSGEVLEVAFNDAHLVTLGVLIGGGGGEGSLFDPIGDLLDLALRDGRGLAIVSTDEPDDLGRVFNDVPGLVVEVHLDENVPVIELLFPLTALAVTHLDDGFDGDIDLLEIAFGALIADPFFQSQLGLILVARVSLNDVPLFLALFSHDVSVLQAPPDKIISVTRLHT